MEIDFSKWAVVGFKDSTGLGRMAADARKVLGVGRQLVAHSERMIGGTPNGTDEIALGTNDADFKTALTGLHGVILLERVNWGPGLVKVAKRMGVKMVAVVMWEWFRGDDPLWREVDFLACPHQMALEVVRRYGFEKAAVLRWPLDWREFPERKISGPARVFVHNAGLIDADDRKGTRETIKAFTKVGRDDLKLIVRMQNEVPLPELDERVELRFGSVVDPGELYAEGDVAVQPSKMEGLGFMVLEPVCAGMPVITTSFGPMNEWVVNPRMWCACGVPIKAFPTQWVKHAFLVRPNVRDLTQKIEWCAENDLAGISQFNRAFAENELNPLRLREQWLETLSCVL